MLDSFFEIQSISNFLIEYESKNIQITYGRLLKRYFNWLEIDPDDYIKSKRDFEKDIKEFERYNTEEEKAPCSCGY